ncbi:MAG TPA: hypothetical protein DDW78_06540 [Treponema sp.]|nr:hypothetical protein [Treponema sp.]
MKKVLTILIVYTAIIFACCIGVTFVYRNIPELIPTDVSAYRFFRGLCWFLMLLPSIFLSGFTVACSVQWQRNTENSRHRFSPAMIERYKGVMIVSLVFVCILAFNAEIFRPLAQEKLQSLESGPLDLASSLKNARTFMGAGNYELSYLYAERAVRLAPKDDEASATFKQAKDKLELYAGELHHQSGFKTFEQTNLPLHEEDRQHSVREIMDFAQTAFDNGEWFSAHYWATLAIEACNGTDTNLPDAQTIAQDAWNHLKVPGGFDNDDVRAYFERKKEGYAALTKGDCVEAYYIFLELKNSRVVSDPDVERFLNLAQEMLCNQYFFIDETQNIALLARSHNVYFSLHNADGTKNVFFIKNAMNSKEDGRTVRYLQGLSVATYSGDGNFLKLMTVPIAKVVSLPMSMFDDAACRSLGLDKTWDAVPEVMLLAVDRTTKGLVSKPVFSYKETGLPEEIRNHAGLGSPDGTVAPPVVAAEGVSGGSVVNGWGNTMILPMPYKDFAVIDGASSDVDRMTILSLRHFIRRATEYGFSSEVFAKSMVSRCTYPLFLLILFIVVASFGWNYRVEGENVQFRTTWLLLIFLFGFVMFLFMEICSYLFSMLNYVLVGALGSGALFAACVLYMLVFVLVSVYFMARRL